MQFTFHQDAKQEHITIQAELHKYLFKVRRHNTKEPLFFRNLEDNNIYKYKVTDISRRETTLELLSFEEKVIQPKKELHLGWCLIDFKSIEKSIASLNELGVTKITFILCQYSQKQKLNLEKLEKLLINSSQQSGRSNIIKLDTSDSLDDFLQLHPASYMFNFSSNLIDTNKANISTIVIGCEGGFSDIEISKFSKEKIVGIDTNMILRSETAVVGIASKILV